MKVYVKVHSAMKDVIVAVCDEDLLGKEFCEGKLKLCANNSFYKGILIDIADLEKYLKTATILNLIGSESIKKAKECGLIEEGNVLLIDGVEHAQMIVV